jgi:hypothetical protein
MKYGFQLKAIKSGKVYTPSDFERHISQTYPL